MASKTQQLTGELDGREQRQLKRLPKPGKLPRQRRRPIADMSPEDSARWKLREHMRRRCTSGSSQHLELPTLPGVQSLSLATRYIDGGRERFIEFMQLAVLNAPEGGDSPVLKWWAVYSDLLIGEREKVSFDDVCAAAGVKPSAIMSIIISTAMEAMIDVGNFARAVLHPQVVAKAAESALRIDGPHADIALEDRKALLQRDGVYLPPKGTGTSITVNTSASAQAAAAAAADPSVPNFLSSVDSLTAARERVQHRLAASAPAERVEDLLQAEPADAVLVDN